ncbi:MAG: TonB-dependent receptor plug domain-containing protein [Sphingobacterium sp.]
MKKQQFQSLGRNRNFRYRLGLVVGAVCLAGVVHAQDLETHGKVTDRKGEPIRGVTISIKNIPNSGMSTSNKGTYELNKLKKNQVLLFTSVGYKSIELTYQGQKELNVQLEEDLANLDEVVVVGFGTKQKKNLTGAVDQISGKVLESRPISNVMQGLQGVSPGLNITYGNGTPGGIPNINIRGTTSINGGSPLFVIDGIPATDANDLIRLNPTDIESYTVLRDAASSAIYGARATYGVILITTKSGKLGKQSVSFNTNSAWGKPTEMPDPVTDPYIFSKLLELSTNNTPWDYVNYSDEHYQWAKERSDNPSIEDVRIDPKDPKRWAYMGNNNWNKYFLNKSAHSQSYNLTFSGGAKVNELPFKYYLSGDYTKENGLSKLAADYWTRKGLRGKINIAPFKWLQLDNNANLYNTHRESPAASLTDIYYLTPIQVAKNPDGTWANTDAGRLAARLSDGGKSNGDMFGFQNTFNATGTF